MESELFAPIKAYFEEMGYRGDGEVGGIDLFMERDGSTLAVELKESLDFKAVRQAALRQKTADTVFIGIFRPKTMRGEFGEKLYLLRRLGIGLITVSRGSHLVQAVAGPDTAELEDYRRRNLRAGRALAEELKNRQSRSNIGGVHRKQLITAYRENALRVLAALRTMTEDAAGAKGATAREIRKACGAERTAAILRDDHYGWFERLPSDPEGGTGRERAYRISPAGLEALTVYADVIRCLCPAEKPESQE